MLAPCRLTLSLRPPGARGTRRHRLRLAFLHEADGSGYAAGGLSALKPLTLRRSFLTFYDLDVQSDAAGHEALQFGPQAASTELASSSEVTQW